MTTPTIAQLLADATAIGAALEPVLPEAAPALAMLNVGVAAFTAVSNAVAAGTGQIAPADQAALDAAMTKLGTDLANFNADVDALPGGAAQT